MVNLLNITGLQSTKYYTFFTNLFFAPILDTLLQAKNRSAKIFPGTKFPFLLLQYSRVITIIFIAEIHVLPSYEDRRVNCTFSRQVSAVAKPARQYGESIFGSNLHKSLLKLDQSLVYKVRIEDYEYAKSQGSISIANVTT